MQNETVLRIAIDLLQTYESRLTVYQLAEARITPVFTRVLDAGDLGELQHILIDLRAGMDAREATSNEVHNSESVEQFSIALDFCMAAINALPGSDAPDVHWIDLTRLPRQEQLTEAQKLMEALHASFAGDNQRGLGYDIDVRRFHSLLTTVLAALESSMIQPGLLEDLSAQTAAVEQVAPSIDPDDARYPPGFKDAVIKHGPKLVETIKNILEAAKMLGF